MKIMVFVFEQFLFNICVVSWSVVSPGEWMVVSVGFHSVGIKLRFCYQKNFQSAVLASNCQNSVSLLPKLMHFFGY